MRGDSKFSISGQVSLKNKNTEMTIIRFVAWVTSSPLGGDTDPGLGAGTFCESIFFLKKQSNFKPGTGSAT